MFDKLLTTAATHCRLWWPHVELQPRISALMAVAQQPLPSHLINYLELEPTTFPWQKFKCVKINEITTVRQFTKKKQLGCFWSCCFFSCF